MDRRIVQLVMRSLHSRVGREGKGTGGRLSHGERKIAAASVAGHSHEPRSCANTKSIARAKVSGEAITSATLGRVPIILV